MSSSSDSSPPRDVALSDSRHSEKDDDDSFVLRAIRQLPLPSAPTALAFDNRTGLSTPSSRTVAAVAPAAVSLPVPLPVLPLPNPATQTSPDAAPAQMDLRVARIPRPSSHTMSPSLSSSGTVPLLSATAALVAAEAATVPPPTHICFASPQETPVSAVDVPAPSLVAAEQVQSAAQTPSPSLVPAVAVASAATVSIPGLAAAQKTVTFAAVDVPCAVTTLLPPSTQPDPLNPA